MNAEGIDYMFGTIAKIRRNIFHRVLSFSDAIGANREYRMQILQKATFKRWLEDKVIRRGYHSSATLFGEPAVSRFLRNMGFKRVQMDSDMISFTCGTSFGWLPLPLKRKRFYLPRWAVIYSEIEMKAQKKSGNVTFGECLSLYDAMEIYDDHITRETRNEL